MAREIDNDENRDGARNDDGNDKKQRQGRLQQPQAAVSLITARATPSSSHNTMAAASKMPSSRHLPGEALTKHHHDVVAVAFAQLLLYMKWQ